MRAPGLVLAVIVAAHAIGATARAQEPPADEPAYRALIDEAVAEFDRAGFREARALFERAHALLPSARTLRGIGLASYELRDYPAAHRALTAALTHPSRPLTSAQDRAVRALVARTSRFIGLYRVRVTPASTSLTVDGVAVTDAALVLSLGTHELVGRAEGHREASRAIVVRGGEEEELSLSLQPIAVAREAAVVPVLPRDRRRASPRRDDDPWIVVATAGGVAAAVGVVVGLASWLTREEELARCVAAGPRCDNLGTLETERDAAAATTIALTALGGAALLTGVIALGSSQPARQAFSCAPAGAGVVCRGSF